MTVALGIALAFIIVSIVMAVLYGQWINPLVWIGWAFAVVILFGSLIGR